MTKRPKIGFYQEKPKTGQSPGSGVLQQEGEYQSQSCRLLCLVRAEDNSFGCSAWLGQRTTVLAKMANTAWQCSTRGNANNQSC